MHLNREDIFNSFKQFFSRREVYTHWELLLPKQMISEDPYQLKTDHFICLENQTLADGTIVPKTVVRVYWSGQHIMNWSVHNVEIVDPPVHLRDEFRYLILTRELPVDLQGIHDWLSLAWYVRQSAPALTSQEKNSVIEQLRTSKETWQPLTRMPSSASCSGSEPKGSLT